MRIKMNAQLKGQINKEQRFIKQKPNIQQGK